MPSEVYFLEGLPRPSCPRGYTLSDMKDILRTRAMLDEFLVWIRHHRTDYCNGRYLDRSTMQTEPDDCWGLNHGVIFYVDDVYAYLISNKHFVLHD